MLSRIPLNKLPENARIGKWDNLSVVEVNALANAIHERASPPADCEHDVAM
jgi:hypothetical protein